MFPQDASKRQVPLHITTGKKIAKRILEYNLDRQPDVVFEICLSFYALVFVDAILMYFFLAEYFPLRMAVFTFRRNMSHYQPLRSSTCPSLQIVFQPSKQGKTSSSTVLHCHPLLLSFASVDVEDSSINL